LKSVELSAAIFLLVAPTIADAASFHFTYVYQSGKELEGVFDGELGLDRRCRAAAGPAWDLREPVAASL
jgi:hypothetical protein